MSKNVLIIVYKFPPMGGIGTRRWVKFAKYLSLRGYEVHVLTALHSCKDINSWIGDIRKKNIHIHSFKGKYPAWLLCNSKSKTKNAIKRYINFFLKKIFFRLDVAQYDAKPILSEAKNIIMKYEIKNVVASGHPVSINYIATYLKIDLPDLNLIQDYRDNWNDLKVYSFGEKEGFSFFRQKEASAYKEFFALFYADKVLNVSEDLTESLFSKHAILGKKFFTLTNGYDADDYKGIEISINTFDMIYAGSLYNQRIEAVELIMDALITLNDSFLNDNFRLILYTNFAPEKLNRKYSFLLERNLFFRSFVSPSEIIKKIAKSYCALSINSKFAPYAFGTKVFDYMALQKKIVHISEGGALYDLLVEKGQYACRYDKRMVQDLLLALKEDYLNKERNTAVDYSDFSLEALTTGLERYLKQ